MVLDGRTADGTVGLAPNTDEPFTGTRWRVNNISDGIITLELQSPTASSRFLDGRTVKGEVGLVPSTDEPFTGTRWRVNSNDDYFISTKIYSRVEPGARGQGGQISIATGSLSVTNGALLSTSTDGKINANAGSVTINARNSVLLDGVGRDGFSSSVNSDALRDSGGEAGSVIINVPSGLLSITNDAQLRASTRPRSTGNGGDVKITAGQLSVRDEGEVTVDSDGLGDAGSLAVNANLIELDNAGKITGSTASGRGGDISLDVQDLIIMRNDSAIATTANQDGSGGNIIINSPLIVAAPNENSDILADASEGNGGNINITTQGIFGLEFREQLTLQSDVNASSDFGVDGNVEINTPDFDPNSGLVNLPTVPVDTQVVQACTPGSSQANSEFVVTGRGGLPPTPNEALNPDAIAVDWVTLPPQSDRQYNTATSTSLTTHESKPIVEATGWIIEKNGQVVLTASASTATPHSSWQTLANCSS